MATTQEDMIAELQRANAELRRQRDSAMALRNSEYGERIAHQSATIDVLKVMAASPGDPQPVFDLIAHRARDLCDAYGATVYEFDGTLIHWRAATGVSDDPTVRDAVKAMFPTVPTRERDVGRAIMDRQIVHIKDVETEPGLNPALRGGTAKSSVTFPLMRGDVVIGALGLGSRVPGGFSDSQIQLLKTFAEQAVIAIGSAETYRKLSQRTADLQESLEYQTATSDVLQVISHSTFDLQPVLDTLVRTAARLCDADQAAIGRPDGDLWRLAANFGFSPEFEAAQRERGAYALEPDSPTVAARAVHERRIVHINDASGVPDYPEIFTGLGRQRTSLGVPLVRDGESIGYIVLARQRIEPFTDRQIELVRVFAHQAVIAIENTRLIAERREALDRQTATAEVLQGINASPGDLGPVFDAVLERALRLCGASFGTLLTYDGEHIERVALLGVPAAFIEYSQRNPLTKNAALIARGIATRKPVQATDVTTDAFLATSPSVLDALVELGGVRSLLQVPLLKDGAVVGFIAIFRQKPGASPKPRLPCWKASLRRR
jgi:GAF domain-containing protein